MVRLTPILRLTLLIKPSWYWNWNIHHLRWENNYKLKHIFISLLIACAFNAATSNAAILQCKNASGKLVYTDNPKNCADKNATKQLDYEQSESFHNEVPDLLQTLESAGFAGGGTQFCAPVAVSNSLVWLEGNNNQQYQIDLVHKLASADYMNTNLQNGTNPYRLVQGVHKYAQERWGRYRTLEYSGWHGVPEGFRSAQAQPTLNWMTQSLHRKGATWIQIGWYIKEGNNYRRNGGHWVTLVGYENGKLIVHDPSIRSGREFSNQFVSVQLLPSGQLMTGKRSTKAKNHFAIADGLKISSRADLAVIDGAVRFELD